ncbi:MAG: GPW/gp25 family protein [Caldilineaceae bacterium]|nr:GPW/gp25 family protein [Caldilineaceae bacterium]MCB0126580.1 GPW/gp25 family protein [Caldilineaceae bacterium]
MPHIRAWRFGHPDLDRSAGQVGLTLSPRNTIQMVEEEAAIRQAVLLLLSTRPGERVMRPDYGCAIHTLAFSPNDDTTAALAIHYVRRALLRWEPRIEIRSLDANQHPDAPNTLQIVLTYQVRTTQSLEEILLDLELSGA